MKNEKLQEEKSTSSMLKQEVQVLLFGEKGYEWMRDIFAGLEVVNLNMEKDGS
jgi:hypothetical protein